MGYSPPGALIDLQDIDYGYQNTAIGCRADYTEGAPRSAAPDKPKVETRGSLKCTYCGCTHRLSDLKTTANCPNYGAMGWSRWGPTSPSISRHPWLAERPTCGYFA